MDSLLLEWSSFHNPRLDLSDQNKQQKVYESINDFLLPVSKLRKVMELFIEEIRLGLIANPPRKSVFYMSNTFVTDIPDGTEEGDFLAMDLGGTNLRIYLARLKPGTEPRFRSQSYDIDVKYRTGAAEQLFEFLADCLKDFINRNPDIGDKRLPFGFTFSFGFDQKALDEAIMTQFSIATDLPDAIGKDVVKCFQDAINKKGLDIDVLAILNDTTSTLAYGMYLKRDAQIGFILGSGTNTCYLERVDRIEHLDPIKTFGKKVENVIINCENGFLGDNGSIDFVKTEWDKQIDEESIFPHTYGGIITDQLRQNDAIKGPDVSSVESDSVDGPVIALLNRLGYSSAQITTDDIAIVRYVCALIGVRNALLAAVDISAVAQHIGKPLIRVAIDGSLYKNHPKMHTLINDFIAELIPSQKVEIFLADEGSGKGSAFIAAVAHKLKQKY